MIKNFLRHSLVLLFAASVVGAVFLNTQPVSAKMSYTCPTGQTIGSPSRRSNEDIRYCYDSTKVCPPGQTRGDGASHTPDENFCYTDTTPCDTSKPNCPYRTAKQEGPVDLDRTRQGMVKLISNDGLVCPAGLFRGDVSSPGDVNGSECYACDATACTNMNIYAVPKDWSVCAYGASQDAKVQQACVKKSQESFDKYMNGLRGSAPGGSNYKLFGSGHILPGSNAREFCKYYETREDERYPWQMFVDACWIGYEYGFGKNMICSDRFLGLLPVAPHVGYPNQYARSVHRYLRQLGEPGSEKPEYRYEVGNNNPYIPGFYKPQSQEALSVRNKIAGKILAACRDGYMQYMVDYYYCGDDNGCRQALRADKSRIFDPGYRPERTIDSGPDNTPGMILPQLTSSGLNDCGGTQTAYFTCTGGSTASSSSFWQLALILLNIMTSLVAILATGGVVWGALRYASSRDDSAATNEAKGFLRNVLLGIVLYIAMWSIMQYIIPGGLFS